MTGSASSDELDLLLRSGAPPLPDAPERQRLFADVWSRVESSMHDDAAAHGDEFHRRRWDLIAAHAARARRRRRSTRVAAIALAVAVAGGGTAAAASQFFSAHTGNELTGAEVRAGGPGELLAKGGSDWLQVSERATADIPFAPGHESARTWALSFLARDSDSYISKGFLRGYVAQNAVCTWADAWVGADEARNDIARTEATQSLADSVSWTAVRDLDPDLSQTGEGQYGDRFDWLPALVTAAQSGNRQAVLDAVASSARCNPAVIPAIAADADYHGAR